MQLHEVFTHFRSHALKIEAYGGHLYIVGGFVRDFLMQKDPHDVDFCITGLTIDQVIELFPEARIQGKSFSVFVIDDCEFALARTEKKKGHGYNGFEINFDPSVTIEDDLLRRDLTINSIAIDMIHGNIIDPYNGMYDLKNRLLNPTSTAFKDDPVRVLRAARLAANLDFTITSVLNNMMYQLNDELKYLTPDNKFTELKKALDSKFPAKYFHCLKNSGALYVVFPEIYNLIGIPQAHHTDGDAYNHTMLVLKSMRTLTDDPALLYAALTHDLGKATTPKEILPAHHDHESRSVEIINTIDWVPNEWKKLASAYAYDHMRGHVYSVMKRGSKVKLLERIHKTSRGIDGFCKLLLADKPCIETMINITSMQADYVKIYSISGNDLPIDTPKGEAFGAALHQARCKLII